MDDILIIGSGPAGSYLATSLAKRGYQVLVLERNGSVGEAVICSGIIGSEAYKRFELPNVGILGEIENIDFFGPLGASFTYRPGQTLAKIVCRKSFDSSIAARAQINKVDYLFETEVKAIYPETDHVRIIAKTEEEEVTFRARYCAVATGYGSSFPHALGCGLPENLLQAAQIEVPISSFSSHTEIYLGEEIAPESFGWFVPLNNGYARIGLTTFRSAYHHLQKFLNHPQIRKRILPHTSKIQCCYIPYGLLKKPYCRNVLMVGEVAGQVKSTTSGGIYYAFLCADIASEIFDQALQGKISTLQIGPAYVKKVRSLLGREITVGKLFRKIYSKMNDSQIDFLVSRLGSTFFPASTLFNKFHFDWHAPVIQSAIKLSLFESSMNFQEEARLIVE